MKDLFNNLPLNGIGHPDQAAYLFVIQHPAHNLRM